MAEPVGLALGAVGLLGLFSTCLEAFALVDMGRHHGRDMTLLEQKFDNQRYRLLTWARASFPSPTDYDHRLNDPQIKSRIRANLNCIALLFEDKDRLQKRYGLKQIRQNQIAVQRESGSPTMHGVRAFQQNFQQFLTATRERQAQSTVGQVARWAIKDKKKFEDLVAHMKDFIDGLEGCTRSLGIANIQRQIVEKDLAELPEDTTRMVADAASNYGDVVSAAAVQRNVQKLYGWREIGRNVDVSRATPRLPAAPIERNTEEPCTSVLFVDFGNSCRSPMAEAIFRRITDDVDQIGSIDSAGVNVFGLQPTDPRSVATLYHHGISTTRRHPRQITPADFDDFTYILAMDKMTLARITQLTLSWSNLGPARTLLFGQFGTDRVEQVEDPFFRDEAAFEETYQQLTRLSFLFLRSTLGLGAAE